MDNQIRPVAMPLAGQEIGRALRTVTTKRYPTFDKPPAQQYAQMVADLFKEMGMLPATMMHAAVGIAGEVGELLLGEHLNDYENILEESGDAMFYVQKMLDTYGWTVEELLAEHPLEEMVFMSSASVSMSHEASNVLDVVKKSWVYGSDINVPLLRKHLSMFLWHFKNLLVDFELTFDDIRAENQYKLVTGPKARYPSGKYTDAAAIARADKAPEDNPMPNPAIEGNPPVIFTGVGA